MISAAASIARKTRRLAARCLVLAAMVAAAPHGRATTVSFNGSWTPDAGIPDNDDNGISTSQTITADFRTIGSVSVNFATTGGWNGDLYAYLTHDSGISILLNRPGKTAGNPSGSDNSGFNVTFSDAAAADIHTDPSGNAAVTGTWQPDGRTVDPAVVLETSPRSAMLANFNGLDPGGSWTLFVADVASGETATLTSWGLSLLPPDQLTVTSGTTTFSNTKNAYNGPVSVGTGATLEVTATGTMTAMTQISVNGGTLLLGGAGSERINDGTGEAPLTLLSGGTVRLDGGAITESFGTLAITDGGVLDFGPGSGRINFSASSAQVWSGLLSVWNWTGADDELFFGASASGLTAGQMAAVRFYSDNGVTFLGAGNLLSSGSLVPVPEASPLLMPALLTLTICLHRRQRRIFKRTAKP